LIIDDNNTVILQ